MGFDNSAQICSESHSIPLHLTMTTDNREQLPTKDTTGEAREAPGVAFKEAPPSQGPASAGWALKRNERLRKYWALGALLPVIVME